MTTYVDDAAIPADVRLCRALEDTRESLSELASALSAVRIPAPPGTHGAPIRPDTVIAVVASYYSVTSAEVLGPRKLQHIARARQVAMYLTRELTGLSFPRIGRGFSRDHTTVMHGVQKIDREVGEVRRTAEQVADLRELVKRQAAHEALRGSVNRQRGPTDGCQQYRRAGHGRH